MELYQKLRKSLKGKIKFKEPLSRHTTFGIGGPAGIWTEPRDERDLKGILEIAKTYRQNICVIGAGSNILASDKGFKGMVISLSSPYFKNVCFKGNKIKAGAGVNLPRLILLSLRHSLCGLEALAGIPGTIGGAVRMNAGYKRNIGEFVHKVKAMDRNGKSRRLNKKDLRFGYRTSNLGNFIILEAEFKLEKKDSKDHVLEKYNDFIKLRRASQPLGERSAGCIFKNPGKDYAAGRLIEHCGLKGTMFGGAKISEQHANFIVNANKATSSDVVHLIRLIQKRVKKKFNVELKPELVLI